jgi:hypothetical protein
MAAICAKLCFLTALQPPIQPPQGYSRATHAQLPIWAKNVAGNLKLRNDQHTWSAVAAIEFICEHEWEEGE